MELDELLQEINKKEKRKHDLLELSTSKMFEREDIRNMRVLGLIDEQGEIARLKELEQEKVDIKNEIFKNEVFLAKIKEDCLTAAFYELLDKVTAMPDSEEKKDLLRYIPIMFSYHIMSSYDIPDNAGALDAFKQAKEEYYAKIGTDLEFPLQTAKLHHDLSLIKDGEDNCD